MLSKTQDSFQYFGVTQRNGNDKEKKVLQQNGGKLSW